jgi:hypothetical protein
MSDSQEENKMSIVEKNLKVHLESIKRIAKANTVKNKDGLTVVTKDDPLREEHNWESSVKHYDSQNKQ